MALHDEAVDILANYLDQLARGQHRRFGETNRAQLQHAIDQIVEASVQATLQRIAARLGVPVPDLVDDGGELTPYPLSLSTHCTYAEGTRRSGRERR